MKIKMNLKGNFVLVPAGEREFEVIKSECTPSGKPDKWTVSFQDTATGGVIMNTYNFDNDKSLFAMGKFLEVALAFEDGDEFDTKEDAKRVIGLKVLCNVVHNQGKKANEDGTLPTFANINKVISLVTDDGEVVETTNTVENVSPRNAIADDLDDDDDLD